MTLMDGFSRRISIFLGAAALLAAVGLFDYWTGYNVSVFVLIRLPSRLGRLVPGLSRWTVFQHGQRFNLALGGLGVRTPLSAPLDDY